MFVNNSCVNIPFCENGDILITAACGSQNLIGKHAIINNVMPNSATHGGFMLLVKSKNSFFLNSSMSTEWYRNYLANEVSGGNGSIGNINVSSLLKKQFLVPSDFEQQKIGQFFSSLDSLIHSQELKFEKLNNIKQALLEKMFC
ncbi:restriction endonuclease subunit S [Mycoplasma sp. 1458C]|uniref:restriction endonuclease subunit S n=1 Tax=Mycoplasma sp. 1458C TaxID=3401661 RepID=UPI003AACEB84